MDTNYEAYGTRELIERIHELEHERNCVLAWIVCEAWTLLEPREDEHAENWRSYTTAHASEILTLWRKQPNEDVMGSFDENGDVIN